MTRPQIRAFTICRFKGKVPQKGQLQRIGAYFAYKEAILLTAKAAGVPAPFNAQHDHYFMETQAYFTKNVHSDQTNIHKAIEDALFNRDKKCG